MTGRAHTFIYADYKSSDYQTEQKKRRNQLILIWVVKACFWMPLIFFSIEESDVYYFVMHVIMKIKRQTKTTTPLEYFQNRIETL